MDGNPYLKHLRDLPEPEAAPAPAAPKGLPARERFGSYARHLEDLPEPPPAPPPPTDRGLVDEFTTQFRSSLTGGNARMTGRSMEAFGELFGNETLKTEGARIAAMGADWQKGLEPSVPSFVDIPGKGVGDTVRRAGQYVAGGLGQGTGSTVVPLAAGAAGGLAGGALAGPAGALAGAFGGAGLASYNLGVGEVYDGLLEDGKTDIESGRYTRQDYARAAAALGIPIAALDAFGLSKVVGLGSTEARRGLIRRVAAGARQGLLAESATEAAQELISQAAQHALTSGDTTLAQRLVRIIDSGLIGGITGGAMGGVRGALPAGAGAPAPTGATSPAGETTTRITPAPPSAPESPVAGGPTPPLSPAGAAPGPAGGLSAGGAAPAAPDAIDDATTAAAAAPQQDQALQAAAVATGLPAVGTPAMIEVPGEQPTRVMVMGYGPGADGAPETADLALPTGVTFSVPIAGVKLQPIAAPAAQPAEAPAEAPTPPEVPAPAAAPAVAQPDKDAEIAAQIAQLNQMAADIRAAAPQPQPSGPSAPFPQEPSAAAPDALTAPAGVTNRAVSRGTKAERPVSVMDVIARVGIRDDEGHSLRQDLDIRRPGVFRRDGKTIDELGEILWGLGYFGPMETTPRPTESEVLDLIDLASRGRVYTPEAANEVAQERRARENRTMLERRAGELGVPFTPRTPDEQLAEAIIERAVAVAREGGMVPEEIADTVEERLAAAELEEERLAIQAEPTLDQERPADDAADVPFTPAEVAATPAGDVGPADRADEDPGGSARADGQRDGGSPAGQRPARRRRAAADGQAQAEVQERPGAAAQGGEPAAPVSGEPAPGADRTEQAAEGVDAAAFEKLLDDAIAETAAKKPPAPKRGDGQKSAQGETPKRLLAEIEAEIVALPDDAKLDAAQLARVREIAHYLIGYVAEGPLGTDPDRKWGIGGAGGPRYWVDIRGDKAEARILDERIKLTRAQVLASEMGRRGALDGRRGRNEQFGTPIPPELLEEAPPTRKPRAKQRLTKTEERGAADIAKSFGLHASAAGTEAVTALYKLFGGGKPGRITSGIGFDEETYAAAKPHIDAMWREIKAAGGDLAAFARKLVEQFGAEIKPYAMRWFQDQNPKTAGTRVAWKTLREWVDAAHEIGSRGPSRQAYAQQAAHGAALPAALIEAETDVELLRQIKRAFANGESYLRDRPNFGSMGLHIDKADGTRILQALNDRLYILVDRPADQRPGARLTETPRDRTPAPATEARVVNGKPQPTDTTPKERLLLIACCETKADTGGKAVPARELYRGAMFEMLNSRKVPWEEIGNVVVLSAKHGLLSPTKEIAPYNERMSKEKADALIAGRYAEFLGMPKTGRGIVPNLSYLPTDRYGAPQIRDVFIAGAGEYRRVLETWVKQWQEDGLIAPDAAINAVQGAIGVQRSQLGQWVDGALAASAPQPKPAETPAPAQPPRPGLGMFAGPDMNRPHTPKTPDEVINAAPPKIPGAPSPTDGKGSIENLADKVDDTAPTPALPDPVAPASPEEIKPPAQAELTDEKLLGGLGISVNRTTSKNGKPVIEVTGKTFDYRELLKKAGARWYGPKKAWSFWSDEGLAAFVTALRGDPGALAAAAAADNAGGAGNAGSTGRRPAADAARDAELARRAAREREDARPDESRLGPDDADLVSDRTRELIRAGGERAAMPQAAVDGQLDDIALINKAYRSKKPVFVLANEPGTGKTFILAGAIEEMRTSGAQGFVYVTMSRGLIDQVRDDFEKNGFRADDIEFTTYSALSVGENVPVFKGKVAIFDEGHNVKNVQSSRGAMGKQLVADASFSIFSSATPFENPVQAEYLAPTGIFNSLGGFVDWAVIFGAAVKERKIYNDRGEKELLRIPYWPGGQAKVPDAQAARRWFIRQGIFTSRRKILNPELVTSSFRRVEASREALEMYRTVEGVYQAALSQYTDENGKPKSGAGQTFYQIGAHRVNALKRVIESMKVDSAIKLAQQHLADGKRVVFFVETKADRTLGRFAVSEAYAKEHKIKRTTLHAYPKMREMMDAHERVRRVNWRAAGPAPFADFIMDIAREFHEAGVLYELPSTASKLAEAFPKDQVAFYTGAFTDAQNAQAKADFQGGKKRVFIATMAKGGTGLSLHDTTGDKPTVQININLPWSSTQFDQVANRTARYGLRSKAEIDWLFIGGKTVPIERNFEQDQSPEALAMESEGGPVAPEVRYVEDVPLEPRIARRVADRMRSLGATVKGIESRSHRQLEEWTFEDDHDATDAMLSEAAPETEAAQEQAAEADIRGGDDPYRLAERLQQLERGKNRDSSFGYFPTPLPVSMLMSRLAAVGDSDTVLEPSAGTGNLLRFLPGGANITAVELRGDNHAALQKLLADRVGTTSIARGDFMEWANAQAELPQFDTILMNPPFEKRQDAQHVMRAFAMLKPGGRLVAIMSEGPFFASDKQSAAFREFMDAYGGISVKMPAGAFKDYGTSVNTRLVVIDRNGRKGFTEHSADDYEQLRDIEDLIPSRGARYAMPPGTIPGFFSRVRKVIESQTKTEAPGSFWKQQLQAAVNKGQVSLHELNWTGMMQWLGEVDGKILKSDVLEWLDQHGITVTEQEPMIAGGLVLDDERIGPESMWSDMETIQPDDSYFRDDAINNMQAAREEIAEQEGLDPEEIDERDVRERAEQISRDNYDLNAETESTNSVEAKDGSIYELRVSGSYDSGWRWSGENKTHGLTSSDDKSYDHPADAQKAAERWARDSAEERTTPGIVYSSDVNAGGYRGYSLPGGRAHRELLLTLPDHLTPDGKFRNDHWSEYSEGNVIAHMRGAEHTFADGTKGWLWDEMQSDWNRVIREEGTVEDNLAREDAAEKKRDAAFDEFLAELSKTPGLREEFDSFVATPRLHGGLRPSARTTVAHKVAIDIPKETLKTKAQLEAQSRLRLAQNELRQAINRPSVPDMPFRDARWTELTVKRALLWAAQNGYSRMAWVTGKQTQERYNLTKHIDTIRLEDNSSQGIGDARLDGPFSGGTLIASKDGRKVIDKYVRDEAELVSLIGAGPARALLAAKAERGRSAGWGVRVRRISGLELALGGEWATNLYDKQIPQLVEKILKPYGVKVGTATSVDTREIGKEPVRVEPIRPDGSINGWTIVHADGERRGWFDTEATASAEMARRLADPYAEAPRRDVHAIDIPQPAIDALKADGLPLLATASAAAAPQNELTRDVLMQVLADAAKIIPTANVKVAMEMERAGVGRIRGIYEPVKQIVALAVAPHLETANPKAAARMTIRHEAVHFLRANNFITPREWQVLADAARRYGWINDPYAQSYKAEPDVMVEEAVAVAFENWSARTNTYEGAIARVFAKLRAFLDRLRNSLLGRGFQTADDIFNAIERGDVGRRQQGFRERESVIDRLAAAWHGTPHDFDRFDISKIGTGEGAQVYGYGLYFAGNRQVAEWYRDKLAPRDTIEIGGRKLVMREMRSGAWNDTLTPLEQQVIQEVAHDNGVVTRELLRDHMNFFDNMIESGWRTDDAAKAKRDALRGLVERSKTVKGGHTLQVELAPAEDEYLLWDEDLSEQSDKVKAALRTLGIEADPEAEIAAFAKAQGLPIAEAREFFQAHMTAMADQRGGYIYDKLVNRAMGEYPGATKGYPPPPGFNAQRATSEMLRAAGIRGVKYADGSSRGQWQLTFPNGNVSFFQNEKQARAMQRRNGGEVERANTKAPEFNYVIFDDADVTIQARYAVADPQPAAVAAVAKRFGLTENEVRQILTTPPGEMVRRNNIVPPSSTATETAPRQDSIERFPIGAASMLGEGESAWLYVLREFDTREVIPGEGENGIKQTAPYKTYVEWARQGFEPPPISSVARRDDGKFSATNRRRVLAAQEAGVKRIKGWFSPDNAEHRDTAGRPVALPLKYGDVLRAYREAAAAADNPFAGKTTEKLKNMAGKARDQLVIPGAAHVAVAGPLRAKKEQKAADALPLFGGKEDRAAVDKAAEIAKKDQGSLFALFDRSFADRVAAVADEARGGARPPGNVTVEEPKQSRDLSQLKVPLFLPSALFKPYPLLRRFTQRASARLNMMERAMQRMRLEYDTAMKGLDEETRADVMTLLLDAEARAQEDEGFSGTFTEAELRENGVSDAVIDAYLGKVENGRRRGGVRRLLDKAGRLVDQHERAMKPFLRNLIKPQVLGALRRAAGAKGISPEEFDRLLAQRSLAKAQARAGEDRTAVLTQIDERLGVDPNPDTEDALTKHLATLDSIDARLARGSVRRIRGYVPHKFFGSWALYKIVPDDEGGSRLELVPFPETGFAETRAQALRFARDVAGADPEGQYVVRPTRASFAGAGMLQMAKPDFDKLMDGIASTFGTSPAETRDALEAGNVRERSMRRWASFKQRREWVAGHSKDIDRVFDTHLAEVNRYVALDTLKYEALRIEDRMGLTPQNKSRATLAAAFQAYVRDVMGEKQPLETRIDELFERPWAQPVHVGMASGLAAFALTGGLAGNPFVGVLAGSVVGWRMYKARQESGGFASRSLTGELTSMTAHMKLGAFFNVFTPLVNLMQFFVNGLPIVGYEYGLKGSMRAIKAGMAAATGKDSADLRVLRRHNIAPTSNLSEVDQGLARREGVLAKASMFLFNTAERFNRASVFLGAMQKALDASPAQARDLVADWTTRTGGNQAVNLDPEGRFTWAGAQRYANFMTTRANFDMTAANRPAAMRNVFLRVPLQFKNYVVQQIAFVLGLRGREVAVFAAHLFLIAGLLGMPGADQLDWLVEWLSGWSPKTELLKFAVSNAAGTGSWGDLAYFLARGVPAAFGFDISSRAGMGENFIPKLQLTDLIGPLAGTAVRAFQLADRNATFADQLRNWTPGLGAPAKMLEAAANGMPLSMALTDPSAFWSRVGDGRAVLTSPWKHGAPELDPQKVTTGNLALMAVGGAPRDLTVLRDTLTIKRDRQQAERGDRQKAWDRIGQAYQSYYETDRTRFIAVIREEQERLRAKGIDLSNQAVREFIAKQRLPRDARELSTATKAVRRELEGLTR